MRRSTSSYEDMRDELQSQIADLGSELRALRKSVGARSADRYEEVRDSAGDLFDDIWTGIQDFIPSKKEVRRHARYANKTMHDHPGTTAATAVVGVAVIGLLALLLTRR
ncbi:hypothetical protein GRZ55_07545 [Chelativorans sp. ZYF759]|uniref:hypothetical protein n=1 Tax=Chelativorans sp. ZYF759 TaxID=2692213 RepID=UPI00145C51F5|nr:hypothetical protein [Chelativorans sp. ZYF759]NMG39091.1 hypothetical protein [Chelativorans sp. ZYF759]